MARREQTPDTSWYYRVGPCEVGPVMSSRLRQLARQRRLADDDLVRMGRTGDWVPAGSIDWLHAKPRPVAREGAIESKLAGPAPPGMLSTIAGSILDGLRNGSWLAVQAIKGSVDILRQVVAAAALVAIVVGLVQIARSAGLFDWSRKVDPLTTIRELGNEVRRLRDSKASDAEWQALVSRGNEQLPPIIGDLEREAGSDNRLAQMLLWSARDCLPHMFLDSRDEPSAAERQFDEYLHNVELLQQNQTIYGVSPVVMEFRRRSMPAPDPEDGSSGQPVIIAILAADAALIALGIWWWRRRWKTGR